MALPAMVTWSIARRRPAVAGDEVVGAVPDADPDPAIAIQLTGLDVVHAHPADVVIVRLPLPPAGVSVSDAGETVNVHEPPA